MAWLAAASTKLNYFQHEKKNFGDIFGGNVKNNYDAKPTKEQFIFSKN